jgi:hypothetical protein
MQRKNFLRQMAITLPVSLAAPQLLFGQKNKQSATEAALLLIHCNDELAPVLPDQFDARSISSDAITSLSFRSGRFVVNTSNGGSFAAAKLVIAGKSYKLEAYKTLVLNAANDSSIEFGQGYAQQGLLSIKRHQKPQLWLHQSSHRVSPELFKQFMEKKRAAVWQFT